MSYQELIHYLFAMERFSGIRLGLERARAFSEALNHPERAYPTVHVAGSNGKGSTALKIAKALEYSGLKVGLYTSPHLSSFRERIVINGEMISEEEAVLGAQKLFSLGLEATFFELTTFLGFEYFRKEKVDVAVIETGLGGRLDATNVLEKPLVTVITSISLEHTTILGNSLKDIAEEKAGIIKKGVPLIIGPKAALAPILKRAKDLGAAIIQAPKKEGFYDGENSAVASSALEALSSFFSLSQKACSRGLEQRPSCRFEKIGKVILDVAHNEDGFYRLFEALKEYYPHKKIRLVLGMCGDKDIKKCLVMAAAHSSHIHLVKADISRAASTETLAKVLEELEYVDFSSFPSISQGLKEALKQVEGKENEMVVVCGSFYIMAEVREALGLVFSKDSVSASSSFRI